MIRKWTAEENALFLEALDLHGRDWAACVAHLSHSRDVNNFKSHAQKHFISLYRDGRPLPQKVRDSGEGYTLSGKPLDPYSAAARAYGALKAPSRGGALTPDQLQARARNDELLAEQRDLGVATRQKVVLESEEEQRAIEQKQAAAKEAATKKKAEVRTTINLSSTGWYRCCWCR